MVGIAGEDDLDAPDIGASACGPPPGHALDSRQLRFTSPSRNSSNGQHRSVTSRNTTAVLDASPSSELREQLLAETASLTSADFAVTWAGRTLDAKNTTNAPP